VGTLSLVFMQGGGGAQKGRALRLAEEERIKSQAGGGPENDPVPSAQGKMGGGEAARLGSLRACYQRMRHSEGTGLLPGWKSNRREDDTINEGTSFRSSRSFKREGASQKAVRAGDRRRGEFWLGDAIRGRVPRPGREGGGTEGMCGPQRTQTSAVCSVCVAVGGTTINTEPDPRLLTMRKRGGGMFGERSVGSAARRRGRYVFERGK